MRLNHLVKRGYLSIEMTRYFEALLYSLVSLSALNVVSVQAEYYQADDWGNNFGIPGRNASYDYVIVGGGTAGLALATRLAEDTSLTIAVIEAGGFYQEDFGNISSVPGLGLTYTSPTTLLTHAFPAVDWGITTTPQHGLQDQIYHYWRGRTLSGT